MRTAIAVVLTLGLAACSDAPEKPATSDETATPSETANTVQILPSKADPASCERDAAGQVACLNSAFELESCGDAQVLGSMFRENEADHTHSYRTAYGLSNGCVEELKTAAKRRNFRENDKGELIAKPRTGYRETLIIGLQISADGSVVEWERIQE